MSITPDGGLEPSTTWLKVKRSTDWANRVYTLGGIRTHEEMNQQILSLPRLTAPEPMFIKILISLSGIRTRATHVKGGNPNQLD